MRCLFDRGDRAGFSLVELLVVIAVLSLLTGILMPVLSAAREQGRKASAVRFPARKALVTEWLSNHQKPNAAWNSWEGARIYLFADGHCRYLKARQIRPGTDGWPKINLTRNGIKGRDT